METKGLHAQRRFGVRSRRCKAQACIGATAFAGMLRGVRSQTTVRPAGAGEGFRMPGDLRVPSGLRKAVAAVVPPFATAVQKLARLHWLPDLFSFPVFTLEVQIGFSPPRSSYQSVP